MALTNKQCVFVEEYLQCWNASEAARRAGYSEKGIDVTAHHLLVNTSISAFIKERIAEKAMAADEALGRLADQARATIEDFISFTVGPYPTFTLDLDKARERHKLHLIKRLKYNAEGYPEIELHDAQNALKTILEHVTRGPSGSESDPVHIKFIREVRPGPAVDSGQGSDE